MCKLSKTALVRINEVLAILQNEQIHDCTQCKRLPLCLFMPSVLGFCTVADWIVIHNIDRAWACLRLECLSDFSNSKVRIRRDENIYVCHRKMLGSYIRSNERDGMIDHVHGHHFTLDEICLLATQPDLHTDQRSLMEDL